MIRVFRRPAPVQVVATELAVQSADMTRIALSPVMSGFSAMSDDRQAYGIPLNQTCSQSE